MKKMIKILVMSLLIILAVLSCNTQEKKAKVDYILVTPNPVTISRGAIQNFTAIVYGTNNPSQAVAWSITGNNSLFTTITPNGLLTVASDETAINLLVMATSDFDRSKIGTATAQVLQPIVTEIIISPSWVNIEKGATQSFTAVVNGINNPPQTVTWSVTGNNSSSTTINTSGQLTVASAETSAALTVCATSTIDTGKIGTATVTILQPEYIFFGGLVWRVLARDTLNNRALIISENVIETRVYHTSQTSITWENCSLRAYLNNDFYNSFTEIDRARIQPTIVQNPNNPTYGTSGGNITNDKIFLLSIAEAQTYFTSEADRIATSNGTAVWWWLRSPGYNTYNAAVVYSYGNIYLYGISVLNIYGGVRPVLWLNL